MTMRSAAHRREAGSRRGFTLVELLVAVAIFVTVMASVALVFNGAVRTSKQGFQNQEAYELARGAMKVIERDLSRAFTNRNHGDVFSFYGTPIGFTYVGLIAADESSAPNMARVTYVIYHDQFSSLAGSVAQYESKEGSTIPTYYLLRFVEPGADSLDSFPVPWDQPIDIDNTNIVLQQVIDQRVIDSGCPDDACRSLIAQATRRELWIKMLSGGHPGDLSNPTDVPIPSAWTDLPYFTDRFLDPADYVVAENVRLLSLESAFASTSTQYCAATLGELETLVDSAYPGLVIDFDDVLYDSGNQVCVRIVFSPSEDDPNVTIPGEGDPGPVFFDDPTLQFSRAVYSTSDGPRPFFTYWDVGVQENLTVTDPVSGVVFTDPGDNTVTANDKVGQIAFQFWNDWRNLQSDGLDNDGDGVIDVGPDLVFGTSDDDLDEIYGENAGSPLDTRLPVAVTVDLTLFFRSPYPGAPDFNERFTQRIDLPTAYRRTFKQRVADPAP